MIEKKCICPSCGARVAVNSYRRFVVCPYCSTKYHFEGFDYREIDMSASMFAAVEYVSDCPACRGKNMLLGPEGKTWRCFDCGYKITNSALQKSVLWFCDECEAFLNIQDGFNSKSKSHKCTACGYINNTSKGNII